MTGIALVTGSAVRVGREISLHLAEKGWDLALHYNYLRMKPKFWKRI
jgi:NAD(P)-dependent dehydrogenase (short-subunit alcohol dehydrogenase family)